MIELEVLTDSSIQAIDITDPVRARVHAASGFLWLSTPHTTAALILCEADSDMLADLARVATGLMGPFEPFSHRRNDNPNASAHLMSSIFGTQLVLPIAGGQLGLGTYQRIVLVELDGPKKRRVQLDVLPVLLTGAGEAPPQ